MKLHTTALMGAIALIVWAFAIYGAYALIYWK
jgi:hypothetical protein